MRDVAALAGVSLKTVSRVVNREAGVSDDLRERVERAVERLDYTHNLTASNLRRSHGRTGVVGALVQDVSNSFSVGLLRSLEDAARERQCVVLAASIDEETDRERALVADLVARRVDGLILMPSTPTSPTSRRRSGRGCPRCSSTARRGAWSPTASSSTTGGGRGRRSRTWSAGGIPASPRSST